MTALSPNVTVKADSAGIAVPPIVRAVSRAAPTWPPTTAPHHADDRVHPGGHAHLARVDVVGDQTRHRGERAPDAEAELLVFSTRVAEARIEKQDGFWPAP